MTYAADTALTLDEAMLHVHTLVTLKTYEVAAMRPVAVHVGLANVGTILHVVVESAPPAADC